MRRHAELLPGLAATAKHAATHPAGPVLYFTAANAACERWPALTDALLGAAGLPEREFAPPLTRPARAGALLGALGLSLLAAATAWPLAGLARALGLPPLAAAQGRAAVGRGAGSRARRAALRRRDRAARRRLRPARGPRGARPDPAAGAGRRRLRRARAVPLVRLGGVPGGGGPRRGSGSGQRGRARRASPLTLRRAALAIGVSAAVAVGLAFGVPAALGGHPLAALRTALAIHHEQYTRPASYALWLLFDPVDFAGARRGADRGARRRGRRPCRPGRPAGRAAAPAGAFALVTLGALAALVVSGTARGEVGRLWIPLMPLVLASAAAALDDEDPRPAALVGALTAACTLALAAAWRL